MDFNRNEFAKLRNDVKVVLEDTAKKYGLKFDIGKISYSDFDFTMELKGIKHSDDVNGEYEKFVAECGYYGFTPEDYNREFVMRGKTYRLVGFNLRKPKNNCNIISALDGKGYICNDEMVKQALKMMAQKAKECEKA